jgi:hypothetical protein
VVLQPNEREAVPIYFHHPATLRAKDPGMGEGFIEAHHRIPLRALTDQTETMIQDLAPLCANCHRMIHVGDECSIEELRKAFARDDGVAHDT